MRKTQKDYFNVAPNKTCGNARHFETEIDGEIERVNSITGVSPFPKNPDRQIYSLIKSYNMNSTGIKRNHGIPFRTQILCQL